jgi:hypothetical protein
MAYDLQAVQASCARLRLSSRLSENQVEVDCGPGAVLCIVNSPDDSDSLIGFQGTPWHTHGDLMFNDAAGLYVEMKLDELLAGLANGQVLICELWRDGTLHDRYLAHARLNDELLYVQPGEELRFFRAATRPPI